MMNLLFFLLPVLLVAFAYLAPSLAAVAQEARSELLVRAHFEARPCKTC